MLDRDLARLYSLATKVFNQAIGRNRDRFPPDFMFGLMKNEFENLGLQFVTSSQWGDRRYFSYAFTEQRVVMLSSVLRSKRAIYVNIEIMRAFVRFRRILESNEELARRLDALEKKYDAQFRVVFDAIRQLMVPPKGERRPIGFVVKERVARYGLRRFSFRHFENYRNERE